MERIIECVPNFSEGRNPEVIREITDEILRVQGVKLLNVDPGKATHRTVVTFAGNPDDVVEAAFQAIKKAGELIDMRNHHGEHPRFGATDVCPLVPVSGVSMDEVAEYARRLAERVGGELGIPVYCYEYAAFREERRSLACCREGEYEGLRERMISELWAPDYGPTKWSDRVAKTGACAIGARNFLIAYNINLNTTSVRRANAVAFDVRESGRVIRQGDPVTGKVVTDENGEPLRKPGTLKKVRAIGWYIEEYGIAQISMNLTDITVTPIHRAFEEVNIRAGERGMRVTGSELVGMIPLQAMLDAGRYFLKKQRRSTGISDKEIIKIAVKSLGLDELSPFDPASRIIEYAMNKEGRSGLTAMTLKAFSEETGSESPAPGGGSVAAYVGALGAALGMMVANLSAHKRGWDDRWEAFSGWAEKGKMFHDKLLEYVDEDTRAFNCLMEAYRLPRTGEKEREIRSKAVKEATLNAIMVPFQVMKVSFDVMEVIREMAISGNPGSVSDAGVGALCARTAVEGAWLNVKINAAGYPAKDELAEILSEGQEIVRKAREAEKSVMEIVEAQTGI